ncbi:hypothetical protein GMLC_07320 [Geomonas limicola]|uniref:Uncharacterized protein n=1 Tax=Geomonas limicola TaxID=2740186 RepID=A0A6V8N6G5_9BACT|nr:hypothetical protein GMLC_07320 [Geomonas limicola]
MNRGVAGPERGALTTGARCSGKLLRGEGRRFSKFRGNRYNAEEEVFLRARRVPTWQNCHNYANPWCLREIPAGERVITFGKDDATGRYNYLKELKARSVITIVMELPKVIPP